MEKYQEYAIYSQEFRKRTKGFRESSYEVGSDVCSIEYDKELLRFFDDNNFTVKVRNRYVSLYYSYNLDDVNFDLLIAYLIYLHEYENMKRLELFCDLSHIEEVDIVSDEDVTRISQYKTKLVVLLKRVLALLPNLEILTVNGIKYFLSLELEIDGILSDKLTTLCLPFVILKIDPNKRTSFKTLTCSISSFEDINMFYQADTLENLEVLIRSNKIENCSIKISRELKSLKVITNINPALLFSCLPVYTNLTYLEVSERGPYEKAY